MTQQQRAAATQRLINWFAKQDIQSDEQWHICLGVIANHIANKSDGADVLIEGVDKACKDLAKVAVDRFKNLQISGGNQIN